MANDFSGSNAFALYTLDDSSGLVTTDGIGSNDMTDNNTVQQNLVDYQEGNGCADFERTNTEFLYCADGDLDAGFPGKSGGSEMSFTVCFWFQFEQLPSVINKISGLVSKYDSISGDIRSWMLYAHKSDDKVYWIIGYNGGADATSIGFGTALSGATWFHVGATYTAGTKAMKLRIWDDNAGALLGVNATGTAGGAMSPDTANFDIGTGWNSSGSYEFDGEIDEVVIFAGEALSDADIDAIRAGTYGAAAGVAPTAAFYGPLVGPLGGPI